ncbi:MAG: hypothetical protein COV67_14005 [Nitrospinae bacterium CG11_big_fil_rev_8_21_14_0_20_56_8]|nr:MAG: hypothetical protein COV67_14005 [Nitrospinae bacterium CG11_big_fil_rev_8_21_14_0_20_56_8]
MRGYRFIAIGLLAALCGCAHPLSEALRQKVDPQITFTQLIEEPDTYVGKRVLLGGVIVETRNLPDGTEIEVIETRTDGFGYPRDADESEGRFLFYQKGYLESEIYAKGRGIVGVGIVKLAKSGKVGEREYRFPVVEIEQIHLWDSPDRSPYFYPPYWDPFYYHPFYSPRWPYYW